MYCFGRRLQIIVLSCPWENTVQLEQQVFLGRGHQRKWKGDNKNSFPLIPKKGLILLVITDPVT